MNRLLHGRFTNPANQRFAKHLRRYRDNLFVFLDRADVEATNYPAEQDIRIAVVNRKTCGGGNRTAKGAQAQSILMSVLQSCRLLFFTLNREDFSFVIHLDRQPRTNVPSTSAPTCSNIARRTHAVSSGVTTTGSSTPRTGSMLAKPMTSSSPSGCLSRRPSSEA